ncbi:MAG: VOC family protein [Erysipelotrichaceae bacterium]|nr:VOC family protein [Erysipelotrichaceae bacterium]
MQTMKLDHLCVRVRDYEVSKKFYTEVLNAKVYTEWQHWKGFTACFLTLNGGGTIEMLGSGKDELRSDFEEVSGSYIHIAIEVENVEEAVEKAISLGAKPKGEIKDNEIPYPIHIGAVYGPSGEIIEFLKYKN